ncbi:hypothetical protein DM01DRAFT_1345701 [Hesseltinella vesiculosa]|uniref:DNA-directed RNA polymerase III subunit Rpc5 n=1 Tax=Hesseltinella vesiculosa TaxID=101127 RepID=A0A1X2GIJ1_9FUNG|nr:hypothetical protein DM01DRAFT_1345701 [Hesseltinella vesiculosa]
MDVDHEAPPATTQDDRDFYNVDPDDEIVAELPVYLSNALTPFLYLLQYPMRQTPFAERQGPLAARIKPNAKMVQLDLPLDTRSTHYSTERGEEFSMGMHDKAVKTAYDRRMEEYEDERQGIKSKKKEEELLDKMTLTSTLIPTQTNYLVGVLHQGELHLTPLQTIIQMRPGFSYLDKIDDKLKAANKRIQEVERQEEKKKQEKGEPQTLQVSMKQGDNQGATRRNIYSMAVRNADDEDWQPVVYYDQNSPEAEAAYQGLYTTSRSELQCKTTRAAFLDEMSAIK